ncbi:MAG: hypothetical protein IT581_21410 [Verrucomicrobiales bacterium]|nr:hypothetical protein [Verrucomicrobiales bacterium]
MNNQPPGSSGFVPSRLGRWRCAGLFVVALAALACHWRWRQLQPFGLHLVPALTLGMILFLALDATVGFVRLAATSPRQFLHRLKRRDPWISGAWRLACLVTILALFYTVERWRGHRAWGQVTREAERRGEPIDVPKASVRPIAEDQNFAALPIFKPLVADLSRRTDFVDDALPVNLGKLEAIRQWGQPWYLVGNRRKNSRFAPWWDGRVTDFIALANDSTLFGPVDETGSKSTPHPKVASEAEALAQLATGLAQFEDDLRQLQEGSDRPQCVFPLDYERQMWRGAPHFEVLYGYLRIARLRASVRLAQGRNAEALADIELLLRLADYGRRQPWAVLGTHGLWIVLDGLQPIWEGLHARRWSDDDLKTIQAQLGGLDLLKDYPTSVRNDAQAMADLFEAFLPARSRVREVPTAHRRESELEGFMRALRAIYPTGWSLQDQASFHLFFQAVTSLAVDVQNRRALPPSPEAHLVLARATPNPLSPIFIHPKVRQMFEDARLMYPAAQSAIDLARVACALERHRLRDGQYPNRLTDLVPRFLETLPHDLHDGQSLRLLKKDDGVTLYAIGDNGADDLGQTGGRRSDQLPNLTAGDWVWSLTP